MAKASARFGFHILVLLHVTFVAFKKVQIGLALAFPSRMVRLGLALQTSFD
jgi:hypothetical protein